MLRRMLPQRLLLPNIAYRILVVPVTCTQIKRFTPGLEVMLNAYDLLAPRTTTILFGFGIADATMTDLVAEERIFDIWFRVLQKGYKFGSVGDSAGGMTLHGYGSVHTGR